MPQGKGKKKGKSAQSKNAAQQKKSPKPSPPQGMSQARYDRLVEEANAPFKGFRKFIYASLGASGAIGGFVFFTKILAGRDIAQSLPNLALQVGVVALMVFLFRWEDREKSDNS